uniref:Uncharacterized protein n=1 Tax=Candidatus Kentrum sp. TC TaxID=2126339 RepID=A0A451A8M2_9GAMM|nr:MAG: hypothetical protein BECKTC1821E_GA0114239_101258 [Candidatus Kentron sp. TC]VFK62374.1 MAG: hypothetical protein BECKTC1821F_GA0114240_107314 [Candidatus Kentron sp. TC]
MLALRAETERGCGFPRILFSTFVSTRGAGCRIDAIIIVNQQGFFIFRGDESAMIVRLKMHPFGCDDDDYIVFRDASLFFPSQCA